MDKNARQPLLGIEGLRFISSVGIVFAHFLPYAMGYETPAIAQLSVFVDLFFVISGVVIASSYSGRVGTVPEYAVFVQRRLARLYPLHLLTMCFYLSVALATGAGLIHVVNPGRYDWNYLISYLTLTQGWGLNGKIAWNAVTWSISAELFVYLIFPVLLWLMRRSLPQALLVVLSIAISSGIVSELVVGRPFAKLITDIAFVRALPSFSLGVLLALYHRTFIEKVSDEVARVAFIVGCIALFGSLMVQAHPYMLVLSVWAIVAGAYLCDVTGTRTWASWSLLSNQGKLTYSVYLIHPVIATTWLAFVGPKLLGRSDAASWLTMIAGLPIVYGLSVVSYKWFEEPLRKQLGRPLFRTADSRPGALN